MSSTSATLCIGILLISLSSIAQHQDSVQIQSEDIPDSTVAEFLEMFYGKLDPGIAQVLADSGARDNNKRKLGVWNEYQYKPCVLCPSYEINYDSIVRDNNENPENIVFMKERGIYKNDKREGLWFTYESMRLSRPFEWALQSQVNYINDKKEGWEHKYISIDSIQYEYRKIFHINGIPEGPVYGFDQSGDTTLMGQFKNGLEDGIFIFKNDTLLKFTFARVYENGKELESIFYHPNGAIASRGLLIDFQPHGLHRNYDENGKLISELNYQYGVLQGESRFYSGEDKLLMIHTFKDNEMEGLSKYYHSNGQLWSVVEIKDKKLWSIISNFDKDGNPKDKGTLKNGNGSVKRYDENGKLIAVEHYKNGVLKTETTR